MKSHFSTAAVAIYIYAGFASARPTSGFNGDTILRRSPPKANDTIVQLFEWPWTSVAAECTDYLAPFGYGYVQVSPASEHITGSQWWTDYQPVSYILTSKRGSQAEFESMVSTCNAAGVGVIVDVVFNHMSSTTETSTGFAGSSYSKYNYPAVPYTASNFHYCAGNGVAASISDYTNATNVWFCELDSLADLAQEQESVRASISGYLQILLNAGVAGFRVDSSKSMPPANISAIFSALDGSFYATQETVYGEGNSPEVEPEAYVGNGDVIEFRVPSSLFTYFTSTSQGIAQLVTPSPMGAAWGFLESDQANPIMANQDTERATGSSLVYTAANNAYTLGAIFLLAFNYGTPTVYSGYNFSTFDDGAPQASNGYTNAVTCYEDGWRCEQRWPAIANMVGFHNAAGSSALTNIAQGGINQIAFGRGSVGFVAINNEGASWNETFKTSLPDGKYCDVIHDTDDNPKICSGTTYTVSGGSFSATVCPYDAIALFASDVAIGSNSSSTQPKCAASTSSSNTVSVTFNVDVTTTFGQEVYLTGSISQLNDWSTTNAILLSAADYTSSDPLWFVTVDDLPPNTAFQYKFFIINTNGSVDWEADPNRDYTSPKNGSATVNDSWQS